MTVDSKRNHTGVALWIATALTLTWVVMQTWAVARRWPVDLLPDSPFDVMSGWWVASWVHLMLLSLLVWWLRASRWHWSNATAVMVVAAAARIMVVLATQPAVVDDMWRYLHDGQTLLAGESPYARAPAELTVEDAPVPALLSRINNPEWVTIYQPASQLTFAAVMALRVEALDPLGDRTWRLAMVSFDLFVIGLLLWRLRLGGWAASWAMLYAWHPLPIAKLAVSGHQDVVGIAFMLMGLLCCEAVGRRRDVRAVGGGVALAMAVAIKPYALLVLLPAAWAMRRMRPMVWAVAAGALALAALYLPFMLSEAGLARMIETARFFNEGGAFNGSLHPLLRWLAGSSTADGITAGLLVAVTIGVTWCCMRRTCAGMMDSHGGATPEARSATNHHLWLAAMTALLAGLLLASIVHPWYVLWALVLLPLTCAARTGRWLNAAVVFSVWWLAATIPLTYVVHLSDTPYRVPGWVLAVEYGPIYSALAVVGVAAALRRVTTRG